MASDNVIEITDTNFQEEVGNSQTPVLLDFWAEWCMPCRMVAPIVEDLAGEYAGKVKFGKVDTDTNRQTAMNFQIQAIPTLMLFKDGDVAETIVGLVSKQRIEEIVEKVVA